MIKPRPACAWRCTFKEKISQGAGGTAGVLGNGRVEMDSRDMGCKFCWINVVMFRYAEVVVAVIIFFPIRTAFA